MARVNYAFAKKQREEAKKAEKAAKKQRKALQALAGESEPDEVEGLDEGREGEATSEGPSDAEPA